MRALNALLRALRTRRTGIDRDQADHIAAHHPAGDDHPGLAALLEAARAPGTPEELAAEQDTVAAFVAHRKRAARSARRRKTARVRAVLVPVTTGLALLLLAGTAVAARTGNLPGEAQQHAHRLFSALGVPAPRTGTPTPSPTRPAPRPSLDVTALGWCRAWSGALDRPLSREDRRKLSEAAGGEDDIDEYCRDLHRSASASPPAPSDPATAPPSPSSSRSPAPPRSPAPSPSAGGSATPGPSATPAPWSPPPPGRTPAPPPTGPKSKAPHGSPSPGDEPTRNGTGRSHSPSPERSGHRPA
ncbi:hypothetical protein [Actinoplanes sp. URMC 104]|uniref:hypothetical protein n=1 Tax=Actinoplanes sp. URMC 104 TaxID=3423409 RepID=UPI003F1996AC